jgi:hypothetical protein
MRKHAFLNLQEQTSNPPALLPAPRSESKVIEIEAHDPEAEKNGND